jgi:haloacid dehalogenase superfamily, subfamily IA, variant 1 with third motif having Dx(3-4)D or Dx(3-4)E
MRGAEAAIKAVLFDLDNTLHDRDAAFLRWAEGFAAARLGLTPATPAHAEAVAWLVARDDGGYGRKVPLFADLRRRHANLFPETVEEMVDAFHDALIAETHIEEETRALLARLTTAGIPFGIVTNGTARQQRKIAHRGLDRLTGCVLISDVFGAQKPDPSIFLAAAERLGIRPDAFPSVLFVGDHPEYDVLGAGRVSMKTAWLRRGRDWPAALADSPPDVCLDALADLAPFLLGEGR